MWWLLALALLLLPVTADATILFQTDFENAVVPLCPNCTTLPTSKNDPNQGYMGAPPGWSMQRSFRMNDINCCPAFSPFLGVPGTQCENCGAIQLKDACYFVTNQTDPTGKLAAGGGPKSGTKVFFQDYRFGDCNPAWPTPGTNCDHREECLLVIGNALHTPTPNPMGNNPTEIYIRAWIMTDANFGPQANGINTQKLIYLQNQTTSQNSLAQNYSNDGQRHGIRPAAALQHSQDCPAENVLNCLTTSSTDANLVTTFPTPDAWHCYEWHMKYNADPNVADAQVESWVDNTRYMNYSNYRFNGPGNAPPVAYFQGFAIYRQSGNITPGSYAFWDDVAVGDSRVGCGGALPPGTPANLTVTSL